jgi:glycosyltransferase involved in cell wall biosynthesis
VTRILIVSSDVVGERMAGPGIRAWEFAQVLAPGNALTLAAPPPLPAAPREFQVIEASRSSLASAVHGQDAIIVQGPALTFNPGLRRVPCALVVDLYDPYTLENLEIHADHAMPTRMRIHGDDLATIRLQLIAGDYFLCASERQRHFWIGMLSALNRVSPLTYEDDHQLRRLIDVVPFGLQSRAVRRSARVMRGVLPNIAEDDVIFLWGGGIWNWFDPLTLIRATAQAVGQQPRIKVVFLGDQHPNPNIPGMRMASDARKLAGDLQLTDRHVFFRSGWVPYAEREHFLAESDVGVSLHLDNVETTFAFRTRVLDYLWAGLPMLLTEGDVMADLASDKRLGCVVGQRDVDGVARALLELTQDGRREQYRADIPAVAQRYQWPKVLEPLRAFCAAPRLSPDRALRDAGLRAEARLSHAPLPTLAHKGWALLRREGPLPLLRRIYRYGRRVR